jgi:hypothetical protein
MVDVVNNPPHYNQAGIECIDAIRAATGDGFQYYLQGNIMKYGFEESQMVSGCIDRGSY